MPPRYWGASQSTNNSPGMRSKWAGVVRDQRQRTAQRDAGDLQVEIGEGCAGSAEDVLQLAVAARCGVVEW